MTQTADQERTEVWTGAENVINKSLAVMANITTAYDLCIDSLGPARILSVEAISKSYFELKQRGVKIMIITEINEDNLEQVKALTFAEEIRHLGGLVGNFVIADGIRYAGVAETQDVVLDQLVVSNVQSFVKQQQYLFNTLWEKAIPAEQRIKVIEEGTEFEVTEIVRGLDNIFKKLANSFSRTSQRMDSCSDAQGPIFVVKSSLLDSSKEFIERGGRIRLVTEITKENIVYVKEMMKTHEVRHLGGVRANFGVSDKDFSAPLVEAPYQEPQVIFSSSKELVRQHQYLFETMWDKAIPAEYRIKEIEEGVEPEFTEVVTGWDNIFNENSKNLSVETGRIDSCCDSLVPPIIVQSPMYEASAEFVRKGGEIRFITEITPVNLASIKELLKFADVRHIDDFRLNFGCSDNVFTSPTSVYSSSKLPQCIFSSSKNLIAEHRYLFENLWSQAIPAESRIQELEKGTEPERTEVWRDQNVIKSRALEILSKLTEKYDFCVDWKGPSIIVTLDYIKKAYLDVVARGGKLRLITEIVPENLKYCKEMTAFIEVRHLDGIKGNFGIVDEKIYGGTANTSEKQVPTSYLSSTVREFVDQQQSFFDMLWEKGIPAGQRIRELEEGKEPEVIELIHETQKSIRRAFDVMQRTKKELLVLFATPHTFSLAMSAGAAEIYRQLSENGTNVKVLVPAGKDAEGLIRKAKTMAPLIDIRTSNESLGTKLTIMVCDRKVLMSWELRDENSSDPYEAGGVATYTNYESIAGSYAVILDNLWISTEFAENLRAANEKLESKEKAMKEFINIAAHELRTPIQPILGLSEVLRDRTGNNGHETELVDAIIRNARRLARLQEDILDVTRIESDLLKLTKTSFSIGSVVKETIATFEADEYRMNGSGKIKFLYESSLAENTFVAADRTRINQVISNLLSNSLKFMNDGTILVNTRIADEKDMVVVSVTDSGTGIDEEILPKLFTKFASKSKKGTGLGLYICKNIVEAHGGRIWGKNNIGGSGATFSFTLPIKSRT